MEATVVVIYANQWEIEGRRGCSIHYISDTVDRDNARGKPVAKIAGEPHLWNRLREVPGYYDVSFSFGVRDGRPMLRLEDLEFSGDAPLPQLDSPADYGG